MKPQNTGHWRAWKLYINIILPVLTHFNHLSSVRWDGTIYFKEQMDVSQGKPLTMLISTNELKPGVLAYSLSPPNWNLCLIRFFSSHHDNGISEIFSSPVSNHYSMKTVFPSLFFPSYLLCAGGAFRPLQLPYPDSSLSCPAAGSNGLSPTQPLMPQLRQGAGISQVAPQIPKGLNCHRKDSLDV